MTHYRTRICRRIESAPGLVSLWFEMQGSGDVKPGQFFEIATDVRFLRRAVSVADVDGNDARILIRAVGAGSNWLASKEKGEYLDVTGPLGQGINIPDKDPVMLLGGGVGAAPLLYLARKLKDKGLRVQAFLGARTKKEVILEEEFRTLCKKVFVATDDGSYGSKGILTDVLPTLPEISVVKTFYTCGPEPMFSAIKGMNLAQPVYAFLESRMGCGLGLCVGCAVKGKDGRYHRICLEGPVFNLAEVEL